MSITHCPHCGERIEPEVKRPDGCICDACDWCDPKDQNEAACGGSALTAELAGKPEPLQFVIGQANVAMRTLVDYESQYKSSSPKEIQNRILAMADFIRARLDEYSR